MSDPFYVVLVAVLATAFFGSSIPLCIIFLYDLFRRP